MDENENLAPEQNRPFLLSIFCVVVFVYSVVFILLFTAGAIFHNWIFYVLNDYLTNGGVKKTDILVVGIGGIILYTLSFSGALWIWKLKRIGFFIYLISSALISLFPYIYGVGNLINVFIFSVISIVFIFYYRKLN
jgi:hypothetical protein